MKPPNRSTATRWRCGKGSRARNTPDIAISLYHLGRLLHAKGDQEEAQTRYQQALTMTRELPGETHPGVATIINQLAFLMKERGNLAEAETLCVAHATTLQDQLGATHEQTQKAWRGLVAFYEATGAQQRDLPSPARSNGSMSEPDFAGLRHTEYFGARTAGRKSASPLATS